jgi:hypothetical protein
MQAGNRAASKLSTFAQRVTEVIFVASGACQCQITGV